MWGLQQGRLSHGDSRVDWTPPPYGCGCVRGNTRARGRKRGALIDSQSWLRSLVQWGRVCVWETMGCSKHVLAQSESRSKKWTSGSQMWPSCPGQRAQPPTEQM